MKRIFITILSGIFFCNIAYAESYFFKECKISAAVMGNYIINTEKNSTGNPKKDLFCKILSSLEEIIKN